MNGIIIIDKPAGWTSHDVVGKLRGLLHERRIGHGGTLDPMATGVLPVFVGRATRAVEFCENYEKEYIAGIKLGITTDTQDITGNILKKTAADVSKEALLEVLEQFKGEQEQIPPMYSAVKVGGKKLYELARKGKEIERKPRKIEIKKLELIEAREDGEFLLDIICSKGTYIRTLCSDIGDALGCGGVMSSLRRVRAGAFELESAISMEYVGKMAQEGRAEEMMLPVDRLFVKYPETSVEKPEEEKAVLNGGGYKTSLPDGTYRVYDKDGSFLMLGQCQGGIMETIKSFFEVK